jgi:haloacetate dehalogenase
MTDYFPGFEHQRVDVGDGVQINARVGGSGSALLLLHGDPQSHHAWRKVAPLLAEHFRVVAADLRGYGESSKPPGSGDHVTYSKRVVARDQVRLMATLGHSSFAVVGHDRGGRVLHRMLLDHQDTVTAGMVVDIVPTEVMYDEFTKNTAAAYFWWFLNIQEQPMPEHMITADVEGYFRAHLGLATSATAFEPAILEQYLDYYRAPEQIHAVCEDYRAAFTIDQEHHDADTAAGNTITQPFTVIWGRDGELARDFDPIEAWSARAKFVQGEAIAGGHFLPEENPEDTTAAILKYLRPQQLSGSGGPSVEGSGRAANSSGEDGRTVK